MRTIRAVFLSAMLASCGVSHGPGDPADPPTPPGGDASVPAPDGGERPARADAGSSSLADAGSTSPADAGPQPDESWGWLTDEQAECLGLTEPACAGCHLRNGRFYLRPKGVPPPPPDVELRPIEECGVSF